ncbi:MAG: helix-turn-helix domain-containing protein [Chloroflexota bacterium]
MRPSDRHAILADPSRRAILDALQAAGAPLDVQALSLRVGLHRNSVREQLARLAAAGLVRVAASPPVGRGRPRLVYVPTPSHVGSENPWRALASALADEVAGDSSRRSIWQSAGERWGDAAAAGLPPGSAPLAGVASLLDEAGFSPEPVTAGDTELRLRSCPFLPVERRHMDVVCGVHHGFIRGALQRLGSPLDAIALDTFVEPDLCVAHLAPAADR